MALYLNECKVEPTIFPDKTSQIWKLNPSIFFASGGNEIRWEFESEAEFMHLAQLKYLVDCYGPSELFMPYLPYGRQDKFVSNDASFALVPFCALICSLNFKKVTVLDAHNPTALPKGWINLSPMQHIRDVASAVRADTICYPDQGACSRYMLTNYPSIVAEKNRDQSTGRITSLTLAGGDVFDKRILIIDDICDGGATFTKLSHLLYYRDAREVNLYVSHGIFSKGTQILRDAGIKRIFTKDGEVL